MSKLISILQFHVEQLVKNYRFGYILLLTQALNHDLFLVELTDRFFEYFSNFYNKFCGARVNVGRKFFLAGPTRRENSETGQAGPIPKKRFT